MNEDILIAYCFGLLPEDERTALARDLERHPQAATFARHTLDSFAALVLDLPPVRVPDYAKDELVERIRAQLQAAPAQPSQVRTHEPIPNSHPQDTSTAPVPVARVNPIPDNASTNTHNANPADVDAAFTVYDVTPQQRTRHPLAFIGQSVVIAVLVLVGVWWGFLRPLQQDLAIGQLLEQTTSQAGAASYPLLSSTGNSAGASLGVVVRADNGDLLFLLSETAPAGQVYHVWQRRAVDTESAESLGTAKDRAFFVRRQTPEGSTILLTLEPEGSTSSPEDALTSVTLQ